MVEIREIKGIQNQGECKYWIQRTIYPSVQRTNNRNECHNHPDKTADHAAFVVFKQKVNEQKCDSCYFSYSPDQDNSGQFDFIFIGLINPEFFSDDI